MKRKLEPIYIICLICYAVYLIGIFTFGTKVEELRFDIPSIGLAITIIIGFIGFILAMFKAFDN